MAYSAGSGVVSRQQDKGENTSLAWWLWPHVCGLAHKTGNCRAYKALEKPAILHFGLLRTVN